MPGIMWRTMPRIICTQLSSQKRRFIARRHRTLQPRKKVIRLTASPRTLRLRTNRSKFRRTKQRKSSRMCLVSSRWRGRTRWALTNSWPISRFPWRLSLVRARTERSQICPRLPKTSRAASATSSERRTGRAHARTISSVSYITNRAILTDSLWLGMIKRSWPKTGATCTVRVWVSRSSKESSNNNSFASCIC